jgi:hypothetical protein
VINNDSEYSARRPRKVLSIGDLWTGSILVSEDGQRMGLIDFEFAGDWGPIFGVIKHIRHASVWSPPFNCPGEPPSGLELAKAIVKYFVDGQCFYYNCLNHIVAPY